MHARHETETTQAYEGKSPQGTVGGSAKTTKQNLEILENNLYEFMIYLGCRVTMTAAMPRTDMLVRYTTCAVN